MISYLITYVLSLPFLDLPVLQIKGKLKRMEDARIALTLPRANLSGLTGEIDPITILLDRLLKNQDEFKGGTRF